MWRFLIYFLVVLGLSGLRPAYSQEKAQKCEPVKKEPELDTRRTAPINNTTTWPQKCDPVPEPQQKPPAPVVYGDPWLTAQPLDQVFHDAARPHRFLRRTQIILSLYGGFEDFTDVNPLFGVNPFLTPFASNPTAPVNPFFPFTPTTPTAPTNFPFVPTGSPSPPVDGINKFVGIIGFLAEIQPYEFEFNQDKMYWAPGVRYWLENRMEDFPFSREEWGFEMLLRLQSTPRFSDRFAFQAKFLLGIGGRDWVSEGDTLWTMRMELEGIGRLEKGSRNMLFARAITKVFYEEDGVLADLGLEAHLGYRTVGAPGDLFEEMRFYGILRMANRRDYERTADLQEESMMVGAGAEMRIGMFTFSAQLGYYLEEKFKLKPIIIPPTFGTSPLFPPNFFASRVLDPTFTRIDTPGFYFVLGIRAEF